MYDVGLNLHCKFFSRLRIYLIHSVAPVVLNSGHMIGLPQSYRINKWGDFGGIP